MSKIAITIEARKHNYTTLRAAFRSENGAIDLASIMVGIIVIGLIGGVIAATVFAVIPWAQDNAAKQQLDSIHTAQNASYGLSADPTYTPDQTKRNMFTDSQGLADAQLLATSPTYCVIPTAAGKDYSAYAKSSSGKIWTASNSAKKATVLVGFPQGACSILAAPKPNGGVVTTYSSANWSRTMGLAVTADQTVYAVSDNSQSVRKMTANGDITTLAGDGTAGFADGQGTAAKFFTPNEITLGPDGNLYVADSNNYRIRMVTPTGYVSTVLGNGTMGTTDGERFTATLYYPTDVAFDAAGNMYVSESNGKIRKMTPAGAVTTLTTTLPSQPSALNFDTVGNLYVSFNNAQGNIMKITPDGISSILITRGSGYSDFTIEQSTGTIYAVSYGLIDKILPDGTATVLAGVENQFSNVNGTGTDARFKAANSIAIDSTGALIIGTSATSTEETLRIIR